jgi:UDP-N-acetylglucosamine acyltransferase
MSQIDPRAIVSPRARLGAEVRIAAFAVVGDEVELGDGCTVHAHAMVHGPSRFGRGNVFHSFSSVGGDPQDLTYKGERAELIAGDENIFHEYATINRGTAKGGGATRIGHHNLFMAYAHVGHDCQIGDHTVFINAATLAGHVIVEDYATIGAFCPVHQFCRIGQHAYIAACTVITQDVLPFAKVVSPRETRTFGLNSIGLERRGYSKERIAALEKAYRILFRSKLNTTQALEQLRSMRNGAPDVQELVAFLERSLGGERGITK